MANYSAIKAAVNAYIKANGKKEITGRILNSVLNATIDSLGKEFQFGGVLTPADDPGQPDQNVAYIGAAGTYSNFDNLVIESGNIGIFLWNGDWSFETIPVGKDYDNDIQSLTNGLQELSDNVIHLDGINEEDLSIPEGGKLQFANRVYNAQQPDGMGYFILRKNKTFAEQVTDTNTIYEIRYPFDLGGASVTIPSGCVLKFMGGQLSDGTINGSKTFVDAGLVQIFGSDLTLSGQFLGDAVPEWYGGNSGKVGANVSGIINKLLGAYDSVVIPNIGTYYCSDPIVVVGGKSLCGLGFGCVLRYENVESDFVAVTYGNAGGSPQNRYAGGRVCGISISIAKQSTPVLRTACFRLGAITRGIVRDLRCENYNYRSSEYSETEMSAPENYTNYGFMVYGAVELSYIYGLVSLATIPMYLKSSVDSSVFDRGYLQANGYGFAGIYGKMFGTNVSILNYNIALGIYGICCDSTGMGNGGYWEIDNLRIEQLRKYPTQQYSDVACSIYLKGSATERGNVIKNSVLCSSKNIVHIGGNISVRFIDCLVEANSQVRDYNILIDDGSAGTIEFVRFIGGVNAPILIPTTYSAKGYRTPVLYGGGTQANATPANISLTPNATTANQSRGHVGTSRYRAEIERRITLPGTSTVVYSAAMYPDLSSQVKRVTLECEISNDTIYAKYVLLLWRESGNLNVKILDQYGDAINVPIGESATSGKIVIFVRNPSLTTATLEINNQTGSTLYADIKYILHTGDILQRLPTA